MQIEKRDVESNLPRKGFERDNSRQHHIYFNHRHDGKYTGAFTYTSHSIKSIGDTIISRMKQELRLNSARQVADLVNCPISSEEYVEILKSRGVVT